MRLYLGRLVVRIAGLDPHDRGIGEECGPLLGPMVAEDLVGGGPRLSEYGGAARDDDFLIWEGVVYVARRLHRHHTTPNDEDSLSDGEGAPFRVKLSKAVVEAWAGGLDVLAVLGARRDDLRCNAKTPGEKTSGEKTSGVSTSAR